MKKTLSRHALLPMIGLAVLMGGSVRAQAQSIDYVGLETLFGEPVTTSATGKPQRVSEAPVDMDIITADDIRKSGAQDIPEVLRSVPGVNVLQSARQDYDVGVHGYNQPYSSNILVLVNGRQVYLDDYGYTNWATIPVQLSEIRQIEIVKGPNTALFGFNAADGVINIVTMNPLYDNTSSVGVTGGTGNYRDASLVKTFKVTDYFGIRVSAGASKADEFDGIVNSLEPSSVLTSPEKQSVSVDGLIQLTPMSQLRVEASASGVQQTEMTPFNFLTRAQYATDSLKTDYEADTAYGIVKATAYTNWLKTDYVGNIFSPTNPTSINEDVSVMQLADTFKVGVSNAFRVQGEYRHNMADGPLLGPTGASIQEDVYALSGMWGWTINNAWELTNSVRVDRLQLARTGPIDPSSPLTSNDFNRVITKPSYNSGLVWKATPDDSFRLSTARGLRMASLLDFGISFRPAANIPLPFVGNTPVLQIGNPALNPTVVTDYELGWYHKITPIDGALKTEVFTEKTSDATSPAGALVACPICGKFSNDAVIQGGNIGSSNTVGAEFDLKGRINKNWSWGLNDTVQRIYNHYSDPAVNTLALTPVNLTSLHLGYQNGPWESDAFVYYNTQFKQPKLGASIAAVAPLVTIPAHVSLSGRVGYKIDDKTTVALSGQELESAQSLTSMALETERRVFLSLDRAF